VEKVALPVSALTLAACATGCLADTKAQANRREPAKAETAYYQHKAGNSCSQFSGSRLESHLTGSSPNELSRHLE
jgi:hypothetical protein